MFVHVFFRSQDVILRKTTLPVPFAFCWPMLVLHSMCKGFLKFQDHESFDYVNQTVEKELWCDA